RRPRQPLVQPEQHVGGNDPSPRRSEDEEQGDRETDQLASDEYRFAPVSIGRRPGQKVRARLRHPECEKVRQDCGGAGDPEDVRREERQDGALLTDHPADEDVDCDEQGELTEVRSEPEVKPRLAGAAHAVAGAGPSAATGGRRRRPRRSCALAATMSVETLIARAPTAIGRSIPKPDRAPAATGMATTL